MATVFMKWLETRPGDYDRGIWLLTLGRLRRLHDTIVRHYLRPGMQVLEIGCGTGALTVRLAASGARVVALDVSPAMLAQARARLAAAGLEDRVELLGLDATMIADHLPADSFDLVVASLVLSEMSPAQQRYVLRSASKVLAPEGCLLLVDELVPRDRLWRWLYRLFRWPLVVLTWLLTRTTTHPLTDVERLLAEGGYQAVHLSDALGGSLVLYGAWPATEMQGRQQEEGRPVIPDRLAAESPARADQPVGGRPVRDSTCCLPCLLRSRLGQGPQEETEGKAPAAEGENQREVEVLGRLRHQVNWRTRLLDLWTLVFRILPPYPKVRPGLYAVGTPDADSPVLVTANFDLTVRRLVRAIDGLVDVWLLVVDTAGINVWCAAGGGFFTAEKVIAAVKSTGLAQVVRHHALILPQLCANGVDGNKIRRELRWGVHWGPVRAVDIPAYLTAGRHKTDAMRWVTFEWRDRLEMVTCTLGFYGLLVVVPVALFWRQLLVPVVVGLLGVSYFYALVEPWLPGRDGLAKSVPLAGLSLLGLGVYTVAWDPTTAEGLFRRILGVVALSVFAAAELQGMSPRMRGEQANWGWEAVVGLLLLATYWLVPHLVGWR